jgi:hypothetical protein
MSVHPLDCQALPNPEAAAWNLCALPFGDAAELFCGVDEVVFDGLGTQ